MKQLILLSLLCLTVQLSAQNYLEHSEKAYVYQLTNEQALKLIETDFNEPRNALKTFKEFGQPVDSIAVNADYRVPNFPTGHFVIVRTVGEYVEYKFISDYEIGIVPIHHNRKMQFRLIDTLGNFIEADEITLDGKSLKYHSDGQYYEHHRFMNARLLVIKKNDQYAFYEIERYDDNWFVRQWENIIDWEIWYSPMYPLGNAWRRITNTFRPKSKQGFGYITTNKPKYLPNDTVKIKAYLTHKNGRPYNRPLTLKITDYRNFNFEKVIQPTTKGSYVHEFVLGDSLTLDKQYYIQFSKGNNRRLMQIRFRYEDYQLDEIAYDIRSEKKEFKRMEPVVFYASGKDANGQNVLDGEVEILVNAQQISTYHASKVLIPDTIFYYKGALEYNNLETDEMRFVIPEEALPMADLELSVKAVFTNSNGELSTKATNIKVISDSTYIDMHMNADTLEIDYLVNGQSTEAIGMLDLDIDQSEFFVEKTIKLPFKQKINPVFEEAYVDINGETKSYYFGQSETEISEPYFSLVRTTDSVFIIGYNPSALVVNYEIYKVNKKVERGTSNEKMFIWKDKARKKTSFKVVNNYIYNGQTVNNVAYFDYAKNQLTIDIEQPDKIQPGETIDVKIKVKSSKNKAQKNINLVAGAINEQFENANSWDYKAIFEGKKSKRKKTVRYDSYSDKINSYDVYAYDVINWNDTVRQIDRKTFELDKRLYYKLLFADNGYYEQSINMENDSAYAQFAPFVIRNNSFEPVYLIYANRRLLYYHDAVSPYSFSGQPGYNTILIRGRDFEIEIDSVLLKAGEKLFFSVDLDNLPKDISFKKKGKEWTEEEKALLRKSIFMYRRDIRNQDFYVWQDGIGYHTIGNSSYINFGPFEPYRELHFVAENQFYTHFRFEPEFLYEVEENRERLYYNNVFPSKKAIALQKTNARTSLSDTLLINRKIQVNNRPEKPIIQAQIEKAFFGVSYSSHKSSNYILAMDNDTSHYGYIFIHQQTNQKYFYEGKRNTFGDLTKGEYKVYGYTLLGYYFEHEIEVKSDTMTYEFVEQIDYKLDSTLSTFLKLMNLQEIIIENEDNSIGSNSTSHESKTLKDGINTKRISGVITDESGEPLIGVTIIIRDHNYEYGTISDIDGNYSVVVPKSIEHPTIEASYLGYLTFKQKVDLYSTNNIILTENEAILEEVVVVGYGISKKSSLTGSVSTISVDDIESKNINVLTGKVAGVSGTPGAKAKIQIRGASGTPGAKAKIQIRGASSLNGDSLDMSSIYGSRTSDDIYIVDGVVVTDPEELKRLQAASKIRSRFQDYAFWQPNLMTDKNGEATFRVTYPDDVTAYKTFVLGMDKKKQFGIATKTVKSQKTVLAQLSVPRFMIQGDKANIIGKSLNYSSDSFRIQSSFLMNKDVLKTNDFWLNDINIETANISADTEQDTLLLTYKMENELFFDGEKRPIPIYKKGVKETVGSFNILEGDTTISLTFDKNKGNVKLYAQTDILEVLLEDIDYLINYQYGCNEQTASRLMALLMNGQIRTLTETDYENSRPGLKNKAAIQKMIKRLEDTQNGDGSWGWWRGNSANYWMTNYVLKALHAADTSGYYSESYESGLRFITNSLSEMKGVELLNAVALLSDIQQNMDYTPLVTELDSTIDNRDVYNHLVLTQIKQQQGLAYDLQILDTLEKRTLFGNAHYDIDRNIFPRYYGYRYWYTNRYNLTTLAYQLIKNDKNTADKAVKLAAIRGYFLEKRTTYGWRNTFTTAQILTTILPDLTAMSNRTKPQLVIKGNTTETVTEFPFETTFYANDDLEIQKTGTSTVYLTGYQQFWNETPKPKDDIFELTSILVQDDKTVKTLTHKSPAKMVVTVEVKAEADYVMVEIPIPAGCSYGDKTRGGSWYGREAHREYFREKTCVFYNKLSVGTHTIEINLEPRFTGEYTVNPAKAEQMYYPVFYGRNAMKEVKIEEGR